MIKKKLQSIYDNYKIENRNLISCNPYFHGQGGFRSGNMIYDVSYNLIKKMRLVESHKINRKSRIMLHLYSDKIISRIYVIMPTCYCKDDRNVIDLLILINFYKRFNLFLRNLDALMREDD